MEAVNGNGSKITLTGFRLLKLELRNWGTFDKYIWSIFPNGSNALLTGDIGSGKSTIVDAITTLLVRHDRIIYNKAAGAESKERTPYSYIRGAYKNEKADYSGKSQDVYLRDENAYSVILGHFFNEQFGQHITLAQTFWIRNNKPDKFFAIAQQPLTIKTHFSEFGSDIFKLKKRLKQSQNIEVFDSYAEYSNKFRQYFGIKQPEALDLFYQTVSMKSVGNLTDFVREQMLGKTHIQIKVSELVKSYAKLTKAHDAAQRARHQKDLLQPLMQSIEQLGVIKEEISQYHLALTEIPKWFSMQRIDGLKSRLSDLIDQYERNENSINEVASEINKSRDDLRMLESQRDGMEVSKLLHQIQSRIDSLNQERARKEKDSIKYESLCKILELPSFIDEDTFYGNLKKAKSKQEWIQGRLTEISKRSTQVYIELSKLQEIAKEIEGEIGSLRTRQTKIPERNLILRRQILDGLNMEEVELPYVGELIRVINSESAWEGAIERRLHDFGLSLLVPDRHYKLISKYVNDHNLKGRLVYLRIFPKKKNEDFPLSKSSLVNKVEIKTGTEFDEWIEAELADRYNYVCCDTLEEFQREPYALTKEGQIKSGKVKHEKNDTRDINNSKHFVLGWSNLEKIKAYQEELELNLRLIKKLEGEIDLLTKEDDKLSETKDSLRDLLQFTVFADINFKKTVDEIIRLEEEKKKLEVSSNELKNILSSISKVSSLIGERENQRAELQKKIGKLESKVIDGVMALKKNMGVLSIIEGEQINESEDIFANLREILAGWISITIPQLNFQSITFGLVTDIDKSTPEILDNEEKRITEKITSPNGLLEKKRNLQAKIEKEIILTMERYREQYQAETTDVDASIESVPDFQRMYDKLVVDDIPRHEERFKKLLKEGTINGILVFQNQLTTSEKEIERKISEINKHLVDIPYNTGTYITITQDEVRENEIGDFKNNLKACLENIYGEIDNYNEAKFFQVKKILDRFSGESDEDRRWTQRVTDVRQWYTFGASERWQEDNTQKEYYSDSSGKSGGQKEKLAYTILASAIAFQFGLSLDESKSRSFRFVVIDEAFGRGSDESTRYGLRLFKKLNLQLLIVTPLQKVNIIEDYINAVHFVSNANGQNSTVRNITKFEYLKEKEEYFARQESAK